MKGKNNKRSFRKGNGRSNTSRFSKDETCDDKRERSRSAENDISWYTRNPNLLVAAGSFPFPYRPGMQIPVGTFMAEGVTNTTFKAGVQIPGVIAIDWFPTLGQSNRATDPASIAGKEIYARVRKVYSGSLDADAPDYIVYLMALDSIFSYIGWLKRIYRVMNAWTPDNYVLPDAVLASFGLSTVDVKSLRIDRTKFWQLINELVLQSRKFTCPAVMDIFNRHYWMSDNIYTDEASLNSQFFVFNLSAVYKYVPQPLNDGTQNTGPGLSLVKLPTMANRAVNAEPITAEILYGFGRELIDALVAWDDAYTINGYLSRAFEGAPNFIVDEIPSDAVLVPVYMEEVLAQIENLRCLIGWNMPDQDLSGFTVSQDVDTNAVISNPRYSVEVSKTKFNELDFNSWALAPILSVRSDAPTVADSVVATRLQVGVELTSGNATKKSFNVVCATEIPCQMRYILGTYPTTHWQTYAQRIPSISAFDFTDASANSQNLLNQLNVEMFDWHPFLYVCALNTTGGSSPQMYVQSLNVLGDIHNATSISLEDLKNLHKICLYSELNAFAI